MLTELSLNNLAVVRQAVLEPGPGMTVISGETGAGKSLLVDALLLLCGQRADSGVVRHGADRAEVAGSFDLTDAPLAREWLIEQELDETDTLTASVRRIVRADGGSKAWINGRPVTVGQLAQLTDRLIEIHGQHDQQALLARPAQMRLLDAFAQHAPLLAAVVSAAKTWQRLVDRREQLVAKGDVADRTHYLQHQLRELDAEDLDTSSLVQMALDHRRLANADSLLLRLNQQLAELSGGDEGGGAQSAIGRVITELQRHASDDPDIEHIVSLLLEADTQVAEAAHRLETLADRLDVDPESFADLDQRLARVHELARKHRVDMAELGLRRDALRMELEELQGLESELDAIDAEIQAAQSVYRDAAVMLSASRKKAAKHLEKRVTELMQELGMAGGRFSLALEPRALDVPDVNGAERVEMMVAANPGQPASALRKVASGGELSRLSLAVEVATIGLDPVPTMVFDEVDSGIGGAIAAAVGQRLRRLGETRQVLCVTHLPQVASAGHAHYQVSKFSETGLTQSAVRLLNADERELEIARMLGGATVTEAARAAARDLLLSA